MSSAERGASLVEAVVAASLLGVGVVAGLVAWDSATAGARAAVTLARAQCLGQSEVEAVLSAPWAAAYDAPPGVSVEVATDPVPGLQRVTVTVLDPTSKATLYQATVLKAAALSAGGMPLGPSMLRAMEAECPS
jgi:Tfp pilus assembly protein PilV